MELYCVHLEPSRAFHFGQRGVGVEASTEFAPSDTIFSALCSVLRIVDSVGALTDLLAQFMDGTPPFLCSCGFPYVMLGDTPLRFYPAPVVWQRQSASEELRKVRWISESVFNSLVTSTPAFDREYLTDIHAVVSKQEYAALCQEYPELIRRNQGRLILWSVSDVPRVAVDRITSASAVFRAGCLTFAPRGGIWVGFVPFDRRWIDRTLPTLLDLLGEQGLGGERSSGYGAYTYRRELDTAFSLPDLGAGDLFMTLSYYAPRMSLGESAAFSEDCAYTLDVRRGWMGSPDNGQLRRKAVRMVSFGSTLRAAAEISLYGQLVDVTPDVFTTHPVWRYGFALPIRLRE